MSILSGGIKLTPKLYKVTRNNSFVEDVSASVLKGSVSFDPDRTIKWDCKIDTNNPDVIKPYTEFFAPHLTVTYEDGFEETSQFGVYMTVPPSQTINQHGRSSSLEGRDLTWILSQDVFENGYTSSSGKNIVNEVLWVLSTAGFTRVLIQPTATTSTKTVSWKPETTKLQIVNDLLTSIGYYSLYMTKDGYLASRPYQSVIDKSVSTIYDTTDPRARVKVVKTIKRDSTPDRIANKVVVISSSSDTPIVGTKYNRNPASPTSTVALGMTIAKTYNESNVADQATADRIAQQRLETASQVYNRLSLTTTPDMSREPHEAYQLNITDPLGNVIVDGLWNSRGWTIGFTSKDGLMTHDLSNIDNPPMDI